MRELIIVFTILFGVFLIIVAVCVVPSSSNRKTLEFCRLFERQYIDLKKIKSMIKYGFNYKKKGHYYTCSDDMRGEYKSYPIPHWVVMSGSLEAVKFLHRIGMNFNIKDRYGNSVLHNAVWKEHLDIIKYLVEIVKLDPLCLNKNGKTLLHFLYNDKNKRLAGYLISLNIDINKKDRFGVISKNVPDMYKELLGDNSSYLFDTDDDNYNGAF